LIMISGYTTLGVSELSVPSGSKTLTWVADVALDSATYN
jgi:hypothetical protein